MAGVHAHCESPGGGIHVGIEAFYTAASMPVVYLPKLEGEPAPLHGAGCRPRDVARAALPAIPRGGTVLARLSPCHRPSASAAFEALLRPSQPTLHWKRAGVWREPICMYP